MNDATLGVLLTMDDQATPGLRNFGAAVQSQGQVPVKGFSDTLVANKAAVRELAMGVTHLGMAFVGMGAMLKAVNIPMAQQLSNILLFAGGAMTAIGSIAQFVSAIGKVVDALRKLAIMESIVQAFSGPMGWIALAGGAAVAGGAMYAIDRASRGSKGAAMSGPVTYNTFHIAGSLVTEKQIAANVRTQTIRTQNRNATTGYR